MPRNQDDLCADNAHQTLDDLRHLVGPEAADAAENQAMVSRKQPVGPHVARLLQTAVFTNLATPHPPPAAASL